LRKAADRANDLLDELDRSIKATWSDELKAAYAELAPSAKPGNHSASNFSKVRPEVKQLAKQLRQADSEAYSARMDAEDTFDLAEKRLSTSMAREGSAKAIISWELKEKAIALGKAGLDATRAAS
jgi:outer membrane murein-binding lipoprotein Lpp